jgi:chromosome segregation ATPase
MKARRSVSAILTTAGMGLMLIQGGPQLLTAAPALRTAQQAVNSAQTKLTASQQAWNKAEQSWTMAQAAQQNASNKVTQARQAATKKHGAELGLSAAIAEREAASGQINERLKTIEVALKGRPDYEVAEKETEAARNRLSEVWNEKTLSEEEQRKLEPELAARIRRPTEMLKEAEAKDTGLREARQRFQSVTRKLVSLQAQLKKEVEADPVVTKAIEQERQTAAALMAAQKVALLAQQNLHTAQLNLDRQNQQLQAAMTQPHRRHR